MSIECSKVFHFDCCLHHVKSFANVICQRSFFMVIGIGQLLSILICGTAVTSGLLQQESVSIPTGQSFFSYVLLSATFTFWLFWSNGRKSILGLVKDRGWKYFFLALIDVEANYLVVKAYQFTSVTSVQLLDCVTIPTVLILSRCLLRIRYLCSHLTGVVFCLIGASSLVLADHLTEKYQDGESSSNLLGNMLVLSGAVLYGISNVGQEMMVSRHGTLEYLGSYSFFACFISGTQFAILEREDVAAIKFCLRVVLYLVGFVICLYLLMALMSYAMLKIGAMAVNLNLLSSDFFSLVVGIFVFHYKFHVLYFISFALIIIGLIIYNLRPPHSGSTSTETQDALDKTRADGKPADETSDDLRLCSSGETCNAAITLETEQSTMISCTRGTFQNTSDIDETVALQCDQNMISQLNKNNSLDESTDL